MAQNRARRVVRLNYRFGLHARPATFIVEQLSSLDANVYLVKESRRVSARSVIELLMLGVMDGERLTVEAEGKDAEAAVEKIAWLLERGLKERFQEN